VDRFLVEMDRIYVLLESMEFVVGEKVHLQIMDYSSIPFRCDRCHIYGNIAIYCGYSLSRKIWRKKPKDEKGDKHIQRKSKLIVEMDIIH
jgi:hypothetical protein